VLSGGTTLAQHILLSSARTAFPSNLQGLSGLCLCERANSHIAAKKAYRNQQPA